MKKSHTYYFDAPIARLAELLCDEAYNIEADAAREDVVSTRFELEERGEQKTRFTMHTTEYRRTKTGKVDRSGTNVSKTHFTYDHGQNTLSWEHIPGTKIGPMSITGVYSLYPEGERTRVVHDYQIEVRIPLLGGQIAKIVDKEFAQIIPRFERMVNKHLNK